MKFVFIREIFSNKFFFHFASLGPLLLVTYRVLPTLVIISLLVVQSLFLFLIRIINKKWIDYRLWFPTEIFLLSVCIAFIDFLMTVFTPLLRSELGILLPYTMFQVLLFFRGPKNHQSGTVISRNRPIILINLIHSLSAYILMLIVLAVTRELLTYGSIHLGMINTSVENAIGTNFRYFWILASSTSGLLFIFAIGNALRPKK